MSAGAEFTIDELAREAGTTVRSVRVYHERGVLPPPQVKGRT
ncbi:MerR family transcriptional regulator, partial [Nocardia gipuzkoensis]